MGGWGFAGDILGGGMGLLGQGLGLYNAYQTGKQTNKAARQQNQLSDFAGQIARTQWNDLNPMRTSIIDRLTQFMQGGFDPTASAMYGPMKNATEQQFGTAQEAIKSNLPKGGGLQDALAKLEMTKAGTMSGLISQLVNSEYTNALTMGGNAGTSANNSLSVGMGSGPGVASLTQAGGINNAQMAKSASGAGVDLKSLLAMFGLPQSGLG